MNICKTIEEIKGTKSQKIMELINRQLQAEKEKRLNKYLKDSRFVSLSKAYIVIKIMYEKTKHKLAVREKELGIEQGHDNKYRVTDMCRIPKDDHKSLQKAQDLFSVGKKKEAQEIWKRIISKYKLFRG